MSATLESSRYIVLIPAYKPDERLVTLAETLLGEGLRVLVVDDGSGGEFAPVFEACVALGVHLERHPENQGKGCALKTGLAVCESLWPDALGVVTADADGQHTPKDILRVIDAMHDHPDALVLGSRAFVGDVPFKSRAGNAITRFVYRLVTGISIHDTQTGLRGIPTEMIPQMLTIQGDRYEYEMNVLLKIREMQWKLEQVPIETVYIDENASSHFSPLRDATRIYITIFRFAFASLVCFLIDFLLFLLLQHFGLSVFLSYIFARLVSSLVNFLLNKKAVFKVSGHNRRTLLRYYVLALSQMGLGALLTSMLSRLPFIYPAVIKIPVDIMLFFVSYDFQRNWVFKKEGDAPEGDA